MIWKLWATSSLIKYDVTLCIVLQAKYNCQHRSQMDNSWTLLCCFIQTSEAQYVFFSRAWRRNAFITFPVVGASYVFLHWDPIGPLYYKLFCDWPCYTAAFTTIQSHEKRRKKNDTRLLFHVNARELGWHVCFPLSYSLFCNLIYRLSSG